MDKIKVAKQLVKLAKNLIALDEEGDGSGFQPYHDYENAEQTRLGCFIKFFSDSGKTIFEFCEKTLNRHFDNGVLKFLTSSGSQRPFLPLL